MEPQKSCLTEAEDEAKAFLFPPMESTNPREVLESMHEIVLPKKKYRKTLAALLSGTDPAFNFIPDESQRLAILRAPWFRLSNFPRDSPFKLPSPFDEMVYLFRLENQKGCTENKFSKAAWLHNAPQANGGSIAVVLLDEDGFFGDLTKEMATNIVLAYKAHEEEWRKDYQVDVSHSVFDKIDTRSTPLRPSQISRLDKMIALFPDEKV